MINSIDIGKKIKACLDEQDLKQNAFAESIGISAQQLSNFVTGKTVPTLENAVAIANKLNISLDELVGNEVQPENKKHTCYDYAKMLDLISFFEQRFFKVATVERLADGSILTVKTEDSTFYSEQYEAVQSFAESGCGVEWGKTTEELILRITEPRVVEHIKNWYTMLNLRNTDVISNDLYDSWLEGEYDSLKKSLLSLEEAFGYGQEEL